MEFNEILDPHKVKKFYTSLYFFSHFLRSATPGGQSGSLNGNPGA